MAFQRPPGLAPQPQTGASPGPIFRGPAPRPPPRRKQEGEQIQLPLRGLWYYCRSRQGPLLILLPCRGSPVPLFPLTATRGVSDCGKVSELGNSSDYGNPQRREPVKGGGAVQFTLDGLGADTLTQQGWGISHPSPPLGRGVIGSRGWPLGRCRAQSRHGVQGFPLPLKAP